LNADDSQPLGGSSSVSTSDFICPSSGLIECTVLFTHSGVAGQYGLRVFST